MSGFTRTIRFLVALRRVHCLAWIGALLLLFLSCAAAVADIRPSQVLVLYNADWQEDHPLTDPGQDSREVAEYYVRMHTDPRTGEKPYLLGLSCQTGSSLLIRDRLLNADHLEEKSADNHCGVVLQQGDSIRSACDLGHGRYVEFTMPKKAKCPWESLDLDLLGSGGKNVHIISKGRNLHPGQVAVQQHGDWQIRLNGHDFLDGDFAARAACLKPDGKRLAWEKHYADPREAVFSPTGADGQRDDERYLDCIATPVKNFLEDPANALPDGGLLRDHILYFVVGYGLPKTVVAPYGITVGITEQAKNFGRYIDLGQRLQLLHMDLERRRGTQVIAMRFNSGKGSAFTGYSLRTPLSQPYFGQEANPFLHPLVYQKSPKHVRKAKVQPMPFNADTRKQLSGYHLYFSMRMDAPDAVQALELIDRGVYAARHAGPEMGLLPDRNLDRHPSRIGRIRGHGPSQMLWKQGFRHLYYQPRGDHRVELFQLGPETGFFNRDYAFLPGGIGVLVESHQGWNRSKSKFMDAFQRGVTFTAGAARVYQGAPHIHNRSFWDDSIFYPFLLQGRTMGEVLLMNQIHLGWITTFVGDPLFRMPANPLTDNKSFPENPDLTIIASEPNQSHDHKHGQWVMLRLDSDPEHLKVAQMRLTRQARPTQKATTTDDNVFQVVNPRFSARPHVFLPDSEYSHQGSWLLELIDPFGNTHTSTVELKQAQGPAL